MVKKIVRKIVKKKIAPVPRNLMNVESELGDINNTLRQLKMRGQGEYKIVEKLHCLRCNWSWWPRERGAPLNCPKCKSPYWETKRRSDK